MSDPTHSPRINHEARALARAPFMDLVRELVWTWQRFEAVAQVHMRELGLTPAQFDVIATLGNTEGMTLGALAERTLITKSSLTYVVDRLEAQGLLRREVPEGDRRCFLAVLTPEGEALFDRVFPAHLRYLQGFFDKLTPEELEQCKKSLSSLRGLFEAQREG